MSDACITKIVCNVMTLYVKEMYCKLYGLFNFSFYPVTMITCGNIKLTDIELVQQSSNYATNLDKPEITTTIYHCAESISMDQTVSIVCSSNRVSRWNADPSSHGCIGNSTETDSEGTLWKNDVHVHYNIIVSQSVRLFLVSM